MGKYSLANNSRCRCKLDHILTVVASDHILNCGGLCPHTNCGGLCPHTNCGGLCPHTNVVASDHTPEQLCFWLKFDHYTLDVFDPPTCSTHRVGGEFFFFFFFVLISSFQKSQVFEDCPC